MKFSFTLLVSAVLAAQAIALPTATEFEERADNETADHPMHPPPQHRCPPANTAVPLLRSWNPQNTDHFYTTNGQELQNAVRNLGYQAEGRTGKVFSQSDRNRQTVPLYRLWSARSSDHFYTTNKQEADNAVRQYGYVNEGVTGWVFPRPRKDCGAIPLYRTWSAGSTDHFYTTNWQEKQNAVTRLGYSDEGIVGYILPA